MRSLHHFIKIGGHRGLGRTDDGFSIIRNRADKFEGPAENTLQSLLGGLENADFIETDLVATRDGEIVLTHSNDTHLHVIGPQRPAGARYIGDMTLAAVQQLRTGPGGSGEIPSLRRLLRAIRENYPERLTPGALVLNLELKGTQFTGFPGQPLSHLPERALSIIAEEDFPLGNILFSSFSMTMIKEMARLEPDARLGMLFDLTPAQSGTAGKKMFVDHDDVYLPFTKDALQYVLTHIPTLEALHPEVQSLTRDLVARAARHDLAITTWALFEEAPQKSPRFAAANLGAARLCMDHAVPLAMITDRIDDLRAFLKNPPKFMPEPAPAPQP
jgi:glycerophosphoryl diester phosphodiesterase